MATTGASPFPADTLGALAHKLVDGTATPASIWSSSSTAVSEAGDKSLTGTSTPTTESRSLLPSEPGYTASLLNAQAALPTTAPGANVVASAIDVLEALAVQNSQAVWVYDDAVEVGFGRRLASWDANHVTGAVGKVHPVQTREGAGLELAGYANKAGQGKISVFASATTLSYLAPYLSTINGDVVIHVAATATLASLELEDALAAPGVLKALTALPEDWDVVFSAGTNVVPTSAHLYTAPGKVVHIVESTYSAREITAYSFPSAGSYSEFTVSNDNNSNELFLAVSGNVAQRITGPKVVLNTLTPSPEALFAALTGESKRTVTVVGPSRADAEALKALVLALLYSAPHSSSAIFPTVKATTTVAAEEASSAKTVSFYTATSAPLPQLLAHLFAASPTLTTALAVYGSSWINGFKSVLSLSNDGPAPALSAQTPSDLIWVSDAAVLKHTDVLATAKEGATLVLELPWVEEEVGTKLSAAEIQTIQDKKIRVFLLDVDATCPLNPIREQVAFLLLYSGSQKLPKGMWKVLDAFHHGLLPRDPIEEAQAGLMEIPPNVVAAWEVDPEKVGKTKDAWSWDAIEPAALEEAPAPQLSNWELAARHLFFREAFAVPDAKTVDGDDVTPGIEALAPELAEETFLVKVVENRRLTPVTYDRNVFHLELDTAGTGLTYAIGEAIGIHGWNDAAEVAEFCKWYGLDADGVFSIPNPLQEGTVTTRTVFQLLQQNIDLFGQPGKAFYAELAKLATDRHEAMRLKFISAPEGAELFQRMSENETVNFADVLRLFPSAHPTFAQLIELVPEIKPRHYSIASSQAAVGDKVELLIVTVDWTDTNGRQRFGQCTRYLNDLKPGSTVTVSIKPSVMKLPDDHRAPVIMAGLGTGAAPFRAFMQHRAWQREQGLEDLGPLYYYFGARHASTEFLYGSDIEAYLHAGIIAHAGLAFSRDGPNKVYIQHKMTEDKKLLSSLLLGTSGRPGGSFYLCGPTWPVPDVFEALASSLTEATDMSREQAEQYIEDLKEDERYVLEVY